MLSKQSTDWRFGPLLGWKGSNGTRLVLLDEVHTYSGVSGAQVALMLRRWRNANRKHGHPSPCSSACRRRCATLATSCPP